ncbi:phosphatase PAP2 family protein [Patescibacteria group bacterium]|nr:phosphatase PAP2 family protein [Patescibacteria group bacterium]
MKYSELQLVEQAQRLTKTSYDFWYFISVRGMWVFVVYFLIIWRMFDFAFDSLIKILAVVPLTFVVSFFIRRIVKRKRPLVTTSYKPFLHEYSFPSIHASVSFAFATALSLLSSGLLSDTVFAVLCICLYGVATLIAFSRMAVGVHYFTDLLSGAVVGAVIALLLV